MTGIQYLWCLDHRGEVYGWSETDVCLVQHRAGILIQWPPGISSKATVLWELLGSFEVSLHLLLRAHLSFLPSLLWFFFPAITKKSFGSPGRPGLSRFFLWNYLKLDSACQLCSSSGSVTWGAKRFFYPSQFNSGMEIQVSLRRKVWSRKNVRTRGYIWAVLWNMTFRTRHGCCIYESLAVSVNTENCTGWDLPAFRMEGGRAHGALTLPEPL